jgi:hypothetical protein
MALVPIYYFKDLFNSCELLKFLMAVVPMYYFKGSLNSYELLKITT